MHINSKRKMHFKFLNTKSENLYINKIDEIKSIFEPENSMQIESTITPYIFNFINKNY